jgi:uncharacterized Tic20 family protein
MNALSSRLPNLRDERQRAAAPHSLFGLCLVLAAVSGVWGAAFYLLALVGTCWFAWSARAAMPFALRHARESLNVQLSMLLVFIAAYLVNRLNPGPDNPPLLVVAVIGSFAGALAQSWIASNKAAKGLDYRMPVAIRFFR